VNKGDLIAHVSLHASVSKRVATEVVDAVLDAVKRSVARGERVSIPGFGTFEKRLRAPRMARNPRTGTRVPVPAMSVPVFRPGQEFKDACRGRKPSRRRR
jgi:DNA-binding protein HU-beta